MFQPFNRFAPFQSSQAINVGDFELREFSKYVAAVIWAWVFEAKKRFGLSVLDYMVVDYEGRQGFVKRLGRLASETAKAIYAWGLMTDHAHL
jgi:hypothetical protein